MSQLKTRTMRINTKTQKSLAYKAAQSMQSKQPWQLCDQWWIVKSFRPLKNNQITVYLEEFTI